MRFVLSLPILFIIVALSTSACMESTSNSPALAPSPTMNASAPATQTDEESETGATEGREATSDVTSEAAVEPTSEAAQSSNDLYSLIPSGWSILEQIEGEPVQAEGDLNNDGIPDIAAVLEQDKLDPDSEEAPPRALMIAVGTGDHSYSLSIIADKAILRADEGGIWGDPFESLTIDKGSVVISHYGGSNWRWYNKFRFRFQDGDWYLIGATMGDYFTGSATEENANERDYNLLTGDYIFKTTDDNGEVQIEQGNRGRKELVKLRDFDIENPETNL